MTGQSKNQVDVLLAESLKELAIKRPIEKITIKEITDKAGVIRPTFYNHFQDKFELLEWIITTELLMPIRPLIEAEMITEGMVFLFTNIEKDKAFYSRAVKIEGAVTFHEVAMKCVKQMLLEVIGDRMDNRDSGYQWLTKEIVATYFAQSMCFATEEWIYMGMTLSPREMAEAYSYIMTHSMTEIVNGT